MARGNELTGEARFTYDGEDLLLTINNRCWYEAETVLGESMLDVAPRIIAALKAGRNPLLKHIVAVVYGGLVQNHPDVDEDFCIDMMMSGDENVREGFILAMKSAQPPKIADDAAAEPGNAPARKVRATKAGAGKASSKAGAKRASSRKVSGGKRPAR
jgi:hypothetical protein